MSIDISPNWRTAMAILITVLEDGTAEGKEAAKAELMDLAGRMDARKEQFERAGLTYIEHVDLTGANTESIVGDANNPTTEIHT